MKNCRASTKLGQMDGLMPVAEIAKRLKVSETIVLADMARARAKFRANPELFREFISLVQYKRQLQEIRTSGYGVVR